MNMSFSLLPFCLGVTASWVLAVAAAGAAQAPSVSKSLYGRMPDGAEVDLYTLTNAHGLEVKVMTHGATITSVKTPDCDGRRANITLYMDTFDNFLRGYPLFGSVVGRYANRIAGAKVTIDGVEYPCTPNAGKIHIHGGRNGFQKKVGKLRRCRKTAQRQWN